MDSMFVSPITPTLYVKILTPNVKVLGGVDFGRRLGHEGRTLMNGISAFIKQTLDSSLPASAMWGYSKKMAVYERGSGPSQNTESSSALMFDFSAPGTVRKKCLLVKPHSLWYCYSSLNAPGKLSCSPLQPLGKTVGLEESRYLFAISKLVKVAEEKSDNWAHSFHHKSWSPTSSNDSLSTSVLETTPFLLPRGCS